MKRLMPAAALCLTFVAGLAFGQPCIRMRDGADGYECMHFSEQEQAQAAKFDLVLTTPLSVVAARLSHNGWRAELVTDSIEKAAQMTCGEGYDATCFLQMTKSGLVIELIFSRTNSELPLISVTEVH